MRALSHHRYTWREYLGLEAGSDIRHEFLAGEIFAMAGGSPEHAALAVAVSSALHQQLKGKPCRTYSSDLRIRVLASGLATYPDVSVVCGEVQYDPESANTVVNPVVLVEVLSASTEEYDREGKFEAYQQIASLREYVLVSTRERLIEVFRRSADGAWLRTEARIHGNLRLESIDCSLGVDAIYEGIDVDRANT